ncbi:ABC transporter permease [Nocardioides dubius]|uniref:ABC transporter permease n=1 Tax=Nocardioides dubius TaxID=317019 RepID=A0ABN1TMN3_9ACTN
MTTSVQEHQATAVSPDVAELPAHKRPARRLPRWVSGRRIAILAIQAALLAALLGLWELAVNKGWANVVFYSKPSLIWEQLRLYLTGPDILLDSRTTITETLLGFGLGVVIGVPLGLLLGRYGFFRAVVAPFFTAFNAMPRVALAPMFILWFGIGMSSKVYLIASIVFFLVMVATESGIRTIDPDFVMMGRAIGSSERDMFLKIILPGSIPAIFSGLRLGAVFALLGAVFAEMLAAESGWGRKIAMDSQSFQPGAVFAVLVVVMVFGLLLDGFMSAIERRLMRWQQ